MGFRLVLKMILNDLELRNNCRPALSLQQLNFLYCMQIACTVNTKLFICWCLKYYFI